MNKKQFRTLQQEWYAKVKASGFNDIEGGKDLNKIAASTLPHGHVTGEFLSQDAIERDGQERGIDLIPFQHTDRAERWRLLSAEVQRLPVNHPDRPFLEDWVECISYTEAARRHGLTVKIARNKTLAIIAAAGLKPLQTWARYKNRPVKEPKPEPGKVRHLSKSEIKKLNYKGPKHD